MPTADLRTQFRTNLIRLWQHHIDRSDVGVQAVLPALKRFLDAMEDDRNALKFFESSPESKLLRGLFPAGLPASQHVREFGQKVIRAVSPREFFIVGESAAIKDALEVAACLAATTAPVLISGKTGTGKELFAKYIHASSLLANRPLVTMNCAAVSEPLLLSELFGYESGAFTGASRRGREGKLEAANGGTLFLDEIGDLPLAGQAALLRFLDSGEIQKIGKVSTHKVNVRMIFATNHDLERKVAAGAFRADLYYRIALLPVFVPPLRGRRDDIPLLAEYFLEEFQRVHKHDDAAQITPRAMRALCEYSWPGNVRELRYTLEREFLLSKTGLIDNVAQTVKTEPTSTTDTARAKRIMDKLATSRPSLFREHERWAKFLCARENNELRNSDVTDEFEISESGARIRLAALIALGVLESSGSKKGRRYRLIV